VGCFGALTALWVPQIASLVGAAWEMGEGGRETIPGRRQIERGSRTYFHREPGDPPKNEKRVG